MTRQKSLLSAAAISKVTALATWVNMHNLSSFLLRLQQSLSQHVQTYLCCVSGNGTSQLTYMRAVQMWLVAVDTSGNAQDKPTSVSLQTAPDTTAPTLLPGSGPGTVSLSAHLCQVCTYIVTARQHTHL